MIKTPEINLQNPEVDKYSFSIFRDRILSPQSKAVSWETVSRRDFKNDLPETLTDEELAELHDVLIYALKAPMGMYSNEQAALKNIDLRETMGQRGIPTAAWTLQNKGTWEKDYILRLQFIADTSLTERERREIANRLQIPKNEQIPQSHRYRSRMVYKYLLRNIMPPQRQKELIDLKDFYLPEEIYKHYRYGEYSDRKGVRQFDARVNYLISQEDLIVINDGRLVVPNQNIKNLGILQECKRQIAEWYGDNLDAQQITPILIQEIQSAAERVGIIYSDRIIKNTFMNNNNPGNIIGAYPIFTEKTRQWFVDTKRARGFFRSKAGETHPDSVNTSEEEFKKINNAYNVLFTINNFAKWLSGTDIKSII